MQTSPVLSYMLWRIRAELAAVGLGPIPPLNQEEADAALQDLMGGWSAEEEGTGRSAGNGHTEQRFTERACAAGQLGRFRGSDVMGLIKWFAGF